MSYKKKNILLVIIFVISMLFVYFFSIRKTLDLKSNYAQLLKEQEEMKHLSSRILSLKQKSKYIDSVLAKENISINNSFQQILLKKINTYKATNPIEIIKFKSPITVKEEAIKSKIYPITIKGDFNSLLQFLNYFEQEGLGEIKSFDFIKNKQFSRNRNYLTLELYLKKILVD